MPDTMSALQLTLLVAAGRASGRQPDVPGGVREVVAQRLAHLAEFYGRRARDEKARLANDPHFTLTARQETVVEAGELWALSDAIVDGYFPFADALGDKEWLEGRFTIEEALTACRP